MSITDTFDPDRDGWIFENWSESSPFSWDLFEKTYAGINPTMPLDILFYEIFKNCASKGNCGGMSLLALAMFKHGGWMGFCSPTNFYSGVKGPDRDELYEAINILQARQFSAPGIENFLDLVARNELNDAYAAYNTVRSHLGSGDYCVLSVANDALGEEAHTILPYDATESGGTKYLWVWDPNTPYDDYGPDHYDAGLNRIVIHGPTDWEYIQRDGYPDTAQYPGVGYRVYSGGWCFAVPMSKVLRKARHPLALDMVVDGLAAIFVGGSGAAVAQIEDDQGRRLYTSDADVHTRRRELEVDPSRRLSGIGRWPWYGDREGGFVGELYFARGQTARGNLKITLTGRRPWLLHLSAESVIELEASTPAASRDVIEFAGVGTANQGLRLAASNARRRYSINQVHQHERAQGWHGVKVDDLRPGKLGVDLRAAGQLRALEIVTRGANQNVTATLSRFRDGELTRDEISDLRLSRARPAKVSVRDHLSAE